MCRSFRRGLFKAHFCEIKEDYSRSPESKEDILSQLDKVYLSCPAADRLELGGRLVVYFRNDLALDENGVSFVEPKMLPVDIGDEISSPRMRDFVRDDVRQRLVSRKKSRRHKRETGVFHSAVRKRRREHQKIVLAPDIRAEKAFSRFDEILRLRKLKCSLIDR
jgi:hypothetical protein